MAVVLVAGATNKYVGLSTDTKPTPAAGAMFYATDTQVFYVYDGSAWAAVTKGRPWQ